jgi:hypothetical protein
VSSTHSIYDWHEIMTRQILISILKMLSPLRSKTKSRCLSRNSTAIDLWNQYSMRSFEKIVKQGHTDFIYVYNQTDIVVSLLIDSINFIEKVWGLTLEDEKVLILLTPSIPIELESEPYGDFAIEVCTALRDRHTSRVHNRNGHKGGVMILKGADIKKLGSQKLLFGP